MSSKKSNSPISVRYSLPSPCLGAFDYGDKSAIPPRGLATSINARVKDGIALNRGGQGKRNLSAMDSAVFGTIDTEGSEFDFQSTYPGLYIIQLSFYPPGSVPSIKKQVARFYGAGLSHSNHWRIDGVGYGATPITRLSTGIGERTIQPFRDRLIVTAYQDGVLYLWYAVLGRNGDIWLQRLVDTDYTANGQVIDFCVRVESGEEILYCSTDKGKILKWDGESLTVEHTMALAKYTRIACIDGDKLLAAAGNAGTASAAPVAYQLTVGGAWVDIATPYAGLGSYNGIGPEYVNAISEFLGSGIISGSSGTDGSGGDWIWDPTSPSTLSVAWGNAQATHPAPAVDWRVSSTNDCRIQRGRGVVAGGKYYVVVFHPPLIGADDACSLFVASSLTASDFTLIGAPIIRASGGPSVVPLGDNVIYLSTGFLAQDGAGGLEINYGLMMVDSTNNNIVWYFPIDYGEFWGFDSGQFSSDESYLISDPTLPNPASDPDIPVASFTFSPTTGAHPLTVDFTDTSTSGSSPITSWEWIFLDPGVGGIGGQSNLQNPSFTFTGAPLLGPTVCGVHLKVSNSHGTSFCRRYVVVT